MSTTRGWCSVMVMSGSLLLAACGASGKDQGTGGAPGEQATVAQTAPGEATYRAVCANCHLDHGRGMAPAYRSLVGSPWAIGPVDRSIAIVLYGIKGPVVDSTYTYHASMLPYGNGVALSDTVVATVVTYVRSNWGNTASPVTAADVTRVRTHYAGRTVGFTQAELDAMTR